MGPARYSGKFISASKALVPNAALLSAAALVLIVLGFAYERFDVSFCRTNFCLNDLPTQAGREARTISIQHLALLNEDALNAIKFAKLTKDDLNQFDLISAIDNSTIACKYDRKLDFDASLLKSDFKWLISQSRIIAAVPFSEQKAKRFVKNLQEVQQRATQALKLADQTHFAVTTVVAGNKCAN